MEKNIRSLVMIYICLIAEFLMLFANVANLPQSKSVSLQVLNGSASKSDNYYMANTDHLDVNIELNSDKNAYAKNRVSAVASKDNKSSKEDSGSSHKVVTIEYGSVDKYKALYSYSKLQSQRFSRGQAAKSNKEVEVKANTAVVIKSSKVEGGPGLYYKDIDTIREGTKVTVIGKEGSWCLVEYIGEKGKKRGYVQIKSIEGSNISSLKYNKTQGVTKAKTSLMSGPGKDYEAIGSLKKNEGITILEDTGQWSFVEYNTTRDPNIGNKRGYVLKSNVEEALSIGDNLVNFVSKYEGYYSRTYICGGGKRTIGYGHVILPGESFDSMTKPQARELLKKDLEYIAHRVNELTSDSNLKQQEFDSLVSFAFNVGEGGLKKSDLLKSIKAGERNSSEIRGNFSAWRKAGGRVLLGLERRRYDEWEMFCQGDYLRDAHKKFK